MDQTSTRGISESRRIVYKAAPGERVVIKGSEQITTWVKHNDHVWKVELPDSFFGSFNPFKTNISGGWIKYGRQYHLGDVYRNGKSYREIMSLDTVALLRETFFIEAGQTTTRLYANFGNEDPNQELTEINVRECVFFPEVKGLRYITVDGFTMMHAAANWTCFRAFQKGSHRDLLWPSLGHRKLPYFGCAMHRNCVWKRSLPRRRRL